MVELSVEVQQQCVAYIGRSRICEDSLCPQTARLFAAMLDQETVGWEAWDLPKPLPPLWHWLYFCEPVKQSDLDIDGHEKRGPFYPPIPYSRRMWAGSQLTFIAPLLLTQKARKISTIRAVTFKRGRSGDLCFLDVEHVYQQNAATKLIELQTIVYRESHRSTTPPTSFLPMIASQPVTANSFSLSAEGLFRYSALTFNTHRIHYDRYYATVVEGYPGLVVQGPLMATLIMEHARVAAKGKVISAVELGIHSPVFEHQLFSIVGDQAQPEQHLNIIKADGEKAVSALIHWQ